MSLAHTARRRRGARPLVARCRCRPCVEELESRLAPSASAGSANVAVTTDRGVQQMPSVAADPADPRHLVVAYLDYSLLKTGYAGVGVAVSRDSGTTWQHTSVALPAGFAQGAATPTVQFDAAGHVFVGFMAATFLGPTPPITDLSGLARPIGYQSNNGLFVARSDDGGLNWSRPVEVVSDHYDGTHPVFFELKPKLAIDTFAKLPDGRSNPYFDYLYLAWSRYYPPGQFPGEPTSTGGSDLILAVSGDAGLTWQQAPQPIAVNVNSEINNGYRPPGNGEDAYPQVTVGPEGDIYVVLGSGEVTVYHSTDDGAHFTQPNNETDAYYPLGNDLRIPSPTLTNDQFRTQTIRDIAADPARPGYVYIVAPVQITSGNGTVLDPADVLFARSTDYGATWQTTFQVGPYVNASVLNDDNFGQKSTGTPDDVADGQAMPRLVTDAQGDVGVIWYDTRRDPADEKLDVFGTFSSDGGKTFSANFRITDQSFDPNAGQFAAADGSTSYYMGDSLGLVLVNHTAYAAWTDTRNGNQDIYFASYPISPPPAPPSNRFAPNDTAGLATDLGQVVTRSVPRLTIAAGDREWFRVQAAAVGSLTVSAALSAPGDGVALGLFNANGTTPLATGTPVRDGSGQVIGQSLTFPSQSGETFLVEVLPGPAANASPPAVYTLNVQSLTADLGRQAYDVVTGNLASGANAYYTLTAPAAGSLEVILTPGTKARGSLRLALLNPTDLSVLASGQTAGTAQLANLTVTQGQAVYLHVYGEAGAQGDFSLQFANLDQYTTTDNKTLFFPTGGAPSQVVLADLTGDGRQDIVVDYADQNFVSVLLNNGDGTFQAPRDYAVGAFQAGNPSTALPDFKREMAVADFSGDGIPDLAVLNYQSATISLLLGRGDGTFAPQRLIPTVASPFALAAGDLNGDGITDLVVVDSTGATARQGEVFLGRGDGTFPSPIPFTIPSNSAFAAITVQITDLNHDGKNDLVYEGNTIDVMLGNGDGTFEPATLIGPGFQGGLAVADLSGDGIPDIVTSDINITTSAGVSYWLGNGNGTFQPPVGLPGGEEPIAVAVADLGSQVTLPDGSTVLGPPDGHPDLIVADNGVPLAVTTGPAQVVVLPGLVDARGHFNGFGAAITLAPAVSPLDLKVADVNGDGSLDVVVADIGGVLIRYGKPPSFPPNTTLQSARNLGTVVHLVEPAQTIIPTHTDSYFTLRAPTEAARGAGDEILDFSGDFQGQGGAGLAMQLLDARGDLLAEGERFRARVPQGTPLLLRVYGVASGTGAYTLDIDALPQLVSVQAEAALPGATAAPGGPTANLVLTFQGDRLDPDTAQGPRNYVAQWLGPDGQSATFTPVATTDGQPAVYDPGANIDVATGLTYPTAVRQTVTLLFDRPLPPGSYDLALSSAIQAAPFNPDEAALLAPAPGITGHTLISLDGALPEGDDRTVRNLVTAGGALGSLTAFKAGTPFLTQLHDDLGALLDADLTQHGDDAGISGRIDQQILDRFSPALGDPGRRPVAVLVIWLDPVKADLIGPQRRQLAFSPRDDSYRNTFDDAFASVAGNVELLALPYVPVGVATYQLSVVPSPAARGGVVYFGPNGYETESLTAELRAGVSDYELTFGAAAGVAAPRAAAPLAVGVNDPLAAPDRSAALALVLANLRAGRGEQQAVMTLAPLAVAVAGEAASGPATVVAARGAELARDFTHGPQQPEPELPPSPWEQVLRAVILLQQRLTPLGPAMRELLRRMGLRQFVAAPTEPAAAVARAEPEEAPAPVEAEAQEVPPEPVVPRWGLGLTVALTSLAGGYLVRRGRKRRAADPRGSATRRYT
jgi:hypothetical protein